MILEKYFERPIFWDCFISIIMSSLIFSLLHFKIIPLPSLDNVISITTDISNISLTSTGFILTLLTVLITFRGYDKRSDKIDDSGSVFQVFFSTKLYKMTVDLLKDCIKSLVLISLLGFILKLFSSSSQNLILFIFNTFGFSILCLTLIRCMLILSKLIDLKIDKSNE